MKRNVVISGDFTITELGNGNGIQKPQKSHKAQDRIDALRAHGISVDNFFAMGDEMIVKVVNGIPSIVTDEDPIFAQIDKDGYVCHYKLFRRWVMAQMFRMLRQMETTGKNMTKLIQKHGYEYQWRMVEKELLDQYKMYLHGDMECFNERNLFFHRENVFDMATDYCVALRKYVESVPSHLCKRRPYKKVGKVKVFEKDFGEKVFKPVDEAVIRIKESQNPKELYESVHEFNRIRTKLPDSTEMSKSFINAYKGAGGYFTSKNLILFHNCFVMGTDKRDGIFWFGRDDSAKQILLDAQDYMKADEGWRMIGVMKKLISDNGISIEGKIAEWK